MKKSEKVLENFQDLEKIFDFAYSNKRSQGIYFTKKYIVDFMVKKTLGKFISKEKSNLKNNLAQQKNQIRAIDGFLFKIFSTSVCDPACGNGYFLLEAFFLFYENYLEVLSLLKKRNIPVEELKIRDLFLDPVAYIIKNNIYGVDLNEKSIKFCSILFNSFALISNPLNLQFIPNIKVGNSLIYKNVENSPEITVFEWNLEFPKAFNEKIKNPGFDFVIGNPPYVRVHKQDRELKRALKILYYSPYRDFDLYIVFFEMALRILKEGGVLSYITSDKFLVRLYAKKLRELMLRKVKIKELIDLSRIQAIFPENIYPIISIVKKNKDISGTHLIKYYKITKNVRANLPFLLSGTAISEKKDIIFVKKLQKTIQKKNNMQLVFIPKEFQGIFEKLENLDKIGKIIPENDIFCGTPRAKDYKKFGEFILEDPNKCNRYIKYIVSRNLSPFKINWGEIQIRSIGKHYIHPYFCLDHPPFSHNRLQLYRKKPKILIRANAKKIIAALDDEGYIFNGIYAIIPKEIDCYFILALLNSKLINFYYTLVNSTYMVRGNYFSINKAQLLDLPLCKTTEKELGKFFYDYFMLMRIISQHINFKELYDFFENILLNYIIYELYFESELRESGQFQELLDDVKNKLHLLNKLIAMLQSPKEIEHQLIDKLNIEEIKKKIQLIKKFPWIQLIEERIA